MPYRNYYRKLRRYNSFSVMKYKRRRLGITSRSLLMAKRALRSVKRDNKTRELKFIDISRNNISSDEDGDLIDLVVSTQGTTTTTRVGNKIYLSSIQLKGILALNTLSSAIFRIIMIRDKSDVIGIGDILQYYSVGDQNVAVMSPYNRDHKLDYKVLFDKLYYMNSVKSTTSGFKIKKKLKCVCRLNDADAVQNNQIKLFVVSSTTTGAGTKPFFSIMSRIYYTDD